MFELQNVFSGGSNVLRISRTWRGISLKLVIVHSTHITKMIVISVNTARTWPPNNMPEKIKQ